MIHIWAKMPWSVTSDEDDWGPRAWGGWRRFLSSAACVPSPVRPAGQPKPGQQDRLQVTRNPGLVTDIIIDKPEAKSQVQAQSPKEKGN